MPGAIYALHITSNINNFNLTNWQLANLNNTGTNESNIQHPTLMLDVGCWNRLRDAFSKAATGGVQSKTLLF